MVPVDGPGTASMKPVMVPSVPGMQKPPHRVGKQFRDCFKAAPKRKVKKPAGLKMRPAWLRQDCLSTNPVVCRGDAGCQALRPLLVGLKVVDGYGLVLGPDSDGEGAGSAAQNGVGAVMKRLERWDDAAMTDPDEGGGEELGQQLVGQLGTRIVPRQGKSRTSKAYEKFVIVLSTNISLFCKNSSGNTIRAPKTVLAGERPISSFGCARSPRSTKGNSSEQVAVAARAQSASLRQQCSLSTALFDSGWYAVVCRCEMLIISQSLNQRLEVNCGP